MRTLVPCTNDPVLFPLIPVPLAPAGDHQRRPPGRGSRQAAGRRPGPVPRRRVASCSSSLPGRRTRETLAGMRRRIVGVIGGDKEVAPSEARQVGAAIAEAGLILCTGGLPGPGGAVKNLSMCGAVGAVPDARTIGFLPTGSSFQRESHPFQLYVQTDLSSTKRNAFTGLTPDAMIVFPGSRGTLTEMAFAWARTTPLWLWRSRDFLRGQHRRHQTPQDYDGTVFDQMKDALAILPPDAARAYSVEVLDDALEQALDKAPDADRRPVDLVRAIITRLDGTSTDDETGYPGRRDDPISKRWFESEVLRISGSAGRDRRWPLPSARLQDDERN